MQVILWVWRWAVAAPTRLFAIEEQAKHKDAESAGRARSAAHWVHATAARAFAQKGSLATAVIPHAAFSALPVAQIIWTLSLRLRNGRHAAVRGSEVQGSRRTRKGGLGHRCEVDLRARVRSTATLSPRRLHWRERDCDHKRAIQWDGHCQFRASQPLEARSPATASGASGDVKVNARRRYR